MKKIICPAIEIAEKLKNNGLTNKEVEKGYFIDYALGKCNIKTTSEDKEKTIRREYEAFNLMHIADGIAESKRPRSL